MNLLFIGGPPRSGTTALTEYLDDHPEVLVCRERFKWIPREEVTREVFDFDRILDFEDGYERRDTKRRRAVHEELISRKEYAKLKWIGDKYPGYVRTLDTLAKNNPGASFILTYRPLDEVAESFKARSENPDDPWLGGKDGFGIGVDLWNKAMQSTRDFILSGVNPNVLVVGYEDFFRRSEDFVPLISRFLDLDFDESVRRTWREKSQTFESARRSKEPPNERERNLLEEHADREAEAFVRRYIRQQWEELEMYSPEANRAVVEERRRFAVRIAEKRREIDSLTRRSRRLDRELREVRSSRSVKLLDNVNRTRAGLESRLRRLASDDRVEEGLRKLGRIFAAATNKQPTR